MFSLPIIELDGEFIGWQHEIMIPIFKENQLIEYSGANAFKLYLPDTKETCLRLRVKFRSNNRRVGTITCYLKTYSKEQYFQMVAK